MVARVFLLLSSAALGLGLGGWLFAGGLVMASWLAQRNQTPSERLSLWERRAVAWAVTWLVVGLLLGAWAYQEVWGRAWRWTPGEGWTLLATLAAAAYTWIPPGRGRKLALVTGVAATLLALGAGALSPDWPRLS
jgi:ABC-type transport system involved in cytochrome c biogenesis permease subunit